MNPNGFDKGFETASAQIAILKIGSSAVVISCLKFKNGIKFGEGRIITCLLLETQILRL